jgi:hypothetical protein
MNKKVRLELTIEELNEIYYVLGMADLNRNLGTAKYELIENLLDRIRETLNQD